MTKPNSSPKQPTRWGQLDVRWLFVGLLAIAGCAHVEANYPQGQGPQKWVANLDGPHCEYEHLRFKVDAESPTLEIRQMMDGLDGKMKAGMSKAAFKNMKKRAYVGHELSAAMQEDQNHVFYHGSLSFNDSSTAALQPGCLILTIATEKGVVETRDVGILFLKHANRNDFADSGSGPVLFGLNYNGLSSGDENEIFVRSTVFGTVQSIAVDSMFVEIGARRDSR